jgi:hypothetical protein
MTSGGGRKRTGREWRARRAIARCALPFALVLGAPSASFSQPLICHSIRGVESAAELSRRLTGDWNTYQPRFQILDESSRIIPKSEYDRIRPGWRACIVEEAPEETRFARHVDVTARSGQAPPPAPADLFDLSGGDLMVLWIANARHLIGATDADLTKVWIGATAILALFGWRVLDGYVGRRKAVLVVMSHFANRFVREFERPLIQRPTEAPLRSQLRLSPARARLEILLAPGHGRRYPNLSDHKKNVEYDVVRVLRSLGDDSFVPDALYSRADWVIVPFRFRIDRKRTGAACISSF